MKGTLGIVLMICSPFLVGGLILLVLRLQEMHAHWKYENAVAERNAKIERLGLKPFKGTKQYIHDDADYSSQRDWFTDKKGVWK